MSSQADLMPHVLSSCFASIEQRKRSKPKGTESSALKRQQEMVLMPGANLTCCCIPQILVKSLSAFGVTSCAYAPGDCKQKELWQCLLELLSLIRSNWILSLLPATTLCMAKVRLTGDGAISSNTAATLLC